MIDTDNAYIYVLVLNIPVITIIIIISINQFTLVKNKQYHYEYRVYREVTSNIQLDSSKATLLPFITNIVIANIIVITPINLYSTIKIIQEVHESNRYTNKLYIFKLLSLTSNYVLPNYYYYY